MKTEGCNWSQNLPTIELLARGSSLWCPHKLHQRPMHQRAHRLRKLKNNNNNNTTKDCKIDKKGSFFNHCQIKLCPKQNRFVPSPWFTLFQNQNTLFQRTARRTRPPKPKLTFEENTYGRLVRQEAKTVIKMNRMVYFKDLQAGRCRGLTTAIHLSNVMMTTSHVELVDTVIKRKATAVHSAWTMPPEGQKSKEKMCRTQTTFSKVSLSESWNLRISENLKKTEVPDWFAKWHFQSFSLEWMNTYPQVRLPPKSAPPTREKNYLTQQGPQETDTL